MAANLGHVISSAGKFGLEMPLRKSEQELGFRAFRECICGRHPTNPSSQEKWWCPQCSLVSQVACRNVEITMAKIKNSERHKQPLFVGADGGRLSRQEVVSHIETTAAKMGLSLRKPGGGRRFGGHTFRITGAVFSFLHGAREDEVCDLGGWKSVEVMRKYLRGVPFSKAAGVSGKIALSVRAGNAGTTRSAAQGLPARLALLPAATRAAAGSGSRAAPAGTGPMPEGQAAPSAGGPSPSLEVLLNSDSGVVHKTLGAKTACGAPVTRRMHLNLSE